MENQAFCVSLTKTDFDKELEIALRQASEELGHGKDVSFELRTTQGANLGPEAVAVIEVFLLAIAKGAGTALGGLAVKAIWDRAKDILTTRNAGQVSEAEDDAEEQAAGEDDTKNRPT